MRLRGGAAAASAFSVSFKMAASSSCRSNSSSLVLKPPSFSSSSCKHEWEALSFWEILLSIVHCFLNYRSGKSNTWSSTRKKNYNIINLNQNPYPAILLPPHVYSSFVCSPLSPSHNPRLIITTFIIPPPSSQPIDLYLKQSISPTDHILSPQ